MYNHSFFLDSDSSLLVTDKLYAKYPIVNDAVKMDSNNK